MKYWKKNVDMRKKNVDTRKKKDGQHRHHHLMGRGRQPRTRMLRQDHLLGTGCRQPSRTSRRALDQVMAQQAQREPPALQ